MTSSANSSLTRRSFIKKSSSVLLSSLVPSIVPSSVFGKNAPSNRINMGCIGLGGMGTRDMRAFLTQDDVQIVAVCDPVKMSNEYGHWYQNGWNGNYFGREAAKNIVQDYYANKKMIGNYKGCDAYIDFRDIIERNDIDAITVVTPDHWHAPISIMAAKRGKHIFCEKPMTLTIDEGKRMVETVRNHKVTFQTGSHYRSIKLVRHACELVQNGYIGKLKRIIATVGLNNKPGPKTWKPMPVPDGFDYNMWLGPAPWAPYHKSRCLYTFRFVNDYSGGQTTNLGAHCIDMGQWGNGTSLTGPIEVEDLGGKFPRDGLFDTVDFVHFRALFANGVELICKTGNQNVQTRFEGTDGWIVVRENYFESSPKSLKGVSLGPKEIHLYQSVHHHRNFLDCIKTGRDPVAPVEVGHRSVSICHLGNIAMKLGRKLKWDPDNEVFINDSVANTLLSKPMRAPWHL